MIILSIILVLSYPYYFHMTEKSTYINTRGLESTLPNTNSMFTLAANSMFTLAANSIFTLAASLTSFNVSYYIIIRN